MIFPKIKARVQALALNTSNTSVSDVRTLRTDVDAAWERYILEGLSVALQDNTHELQCFLNCEALLRETWFLIRGTAVSYTAMPDSELTHILTDLASLIADNHNHMWRSHIQQALAAHQETWLELESNYLNQKSDCITRVQELLASQWTLDTPPPRLYTQNPIMNLALWVKQLNASLERVSGPDAAWRAAVKQEINDLTFEVISAEKSYQKTYQALSELLQSSWSTERAVPDSYEVSPTQRLKTHLDTLEADIQNQDNFNALSILMPGVYQGDTGDLSAADILKTHILSDSGVYLYPVSLMADVRLMDALEAQPNNPNYDDARGHADQQINLAEWQRLTMHSPHTEAVIQAKAHYQKVSTEDEHLLSQLTTLIHQLELNDAHGGRGTQEDAAGQAYPPILNFRDYYQALPEEEVLRIPDKIKEEISLLFDVAFNVNSSVRAQNPIETCIGSRREALYAAMQSHKVLLADISLGEGARQGLIEAAMQAFDKAHNELKHALETHTYTGKDNLGVTPVLLQQLGIPVRIASLADMNFIVQGMDARDLADVLSQDNIRSQVIYQLTRLDDLVIFIMVLISTTMDPFHHHLMDPLH